MTIMKCRICSNKALRKFLSLGQTQLANSFLKKEELDKEERKFPLEVFYCDGCKLVQLGYVVQPELMFKNYLYVSSTTNTFRQHFSKMAEDISMEHHFNEKSLAVDIGSNDGILLKGFQKFNVQVIGVEPATNVAKIAKQNGVDTINDFFNENVVKKIISKKGNADVVTATNVFAHIDDIGNTIENVKLLLKDDGIFVIEVQYLADMIKKMTFDNIYHEHLSYFSLTALAYFFSKHGMKVFDAQRNESHGGSLRVFIAKNPAIKVKDSVKKILEYENKLGINDFELYKKFANEVYEVKKELVSFIKNIKKDETLIAGYGAPAKSNTLLNFCGIGNEYISYIVEDNPLKVGLYTPGTHIPVVSSKMLDEKKPDYILVLAWNFAQEILAKTKKYSEQGVKFIIPLPKISVK